MLGAVLAMVFAFSPATASAESADSTAIIIELVDSVQVCKDGEGEGRVRPVFDRERGGDREGEEARRHRDRDDEGEERRHRGDRDGFDRGDDNDDLVEDDEFEGDDDWDEEDEEGNDWDDVDHERVAAFYKKNAPEVLEVLGRLKDENPEEAEELYEGMVDRYFELTEMAEEEPQAARQRLQYERAEFKTWQLGQEIRQLNREARRSPEAKAKAAAKEKELKTLLTKLFDFKLKHEKEQLVEMEEEIEEFKELLERREQNRDKIIMRRLSQLSGNEEDLEW
jgi:hypothetical protein